METIIINNNATAIYATGGGILTQSFPTCYRTFHERVVCRPADTGLWTEWTADQRSAWERDPPEPAVRDRLTEAVESLVRQDAHCPALFVPVLNEATGYYEVYGGALRDVTRAQLLLAYEVGAQYYYNDTSRHRASGIRFNLVVWKYAAKAETYSRTFEGCHNLEYAFVEHGDLGAGTFSGCSSLREIGIGSMYAWDAPGDDCFRGCSALSEISPNLRCKAGASFNLKWSPLLSDATLTTLVTQMSGTESKHATLTLHADAFARLTDGHLAAAAERHIDIVTP